MNEATLLNSLIVAISWVALWGLPETLRRRDKR